MRRPAILLYEVLTEGLPYDADSLVEGVMRHVDVAIVARLGRSKNMEANSAKRFAGAGRVSGR